MLDNTETYLEKNPRPPQANLGFEKTCHGMVSRTRLDLRLFFSGFCCILEVCSEVKGTYSGNTRRNCSC